MIQAHAFRCQSTFDGRDLVKGTINRAKNMAYDMLIRLLDGTPRAQPNAFRLFQIIWNWNGNRRLLISIGNHTIYLEKVDDKTNLFGY